MPGSGLASLSVNNMAVADGQAIDPFWLAPGANTLALRGEDVAGHLTEQAAALDIFATFDSLRATAARLCQESEISGKANCDWITATLGAAQRAANRGDRGTAVAVLNARRQQATAAGRKSYHSPRGGDPPGRLRLCHRRSGQAITGNRIRKPWSARRPGIRGEAGASQRARTRIYRIR